MAQNRDGKRAIRIGWAQTDITPDEPVLITGQFHARLSEGIDNPITSTVLALDSGEDHAVFVSCDLVTISEELRRGVRERLGGVEGLDPLKVVLNATHTHEGPETRMKRAGTANLTDALGVHLDALPVGTYLETASDRIATAVREAWTNRAAGRVAYGLGYAVVGRNRRWVNTKGEATMYGNTDDPLFSHIEGYEDHSVNVLAVYSEDGQLTGVVVNVPSPSQTRETGYRLSADYWHDTRCALRQRHGETLFVLPQCSAAGDQSPHLLFDKRADARMLELKGRSEREELGNRIADAVDGILAVIGPTAEDGPELRHRVETLHLPMTSLTEADVRAALKEAESYRTRYEKEKRKLDEQPELRKEPRWYVEITHAYRRMRWFEAVATRFKMQKTDPTLPVEVHIVRLGDVALATNRFEYYLDFGIHIKARSPACQTFIVQLAGEGTYCPSPRSVAGGGYGSIPASNPVGPEGGRMLATKTVQILEELWGAS
jgi:hypothetical protein